MQRQVPSTIQTVLHAVMNENVTIPLEIVHYMILIRPMALMIQDSKGTDTWDGPNSETFAQFGRCYPSTRHS